MLGSQFSSAALQAYTLRTQLEFVHYKWGLKGLAMLY